MVRVSFNIWIMAPSKKCIRNGGLDILGAIYQMHAVDIRRIGSNTASEPKLN